MASRRHLCRKEPQGREAGRYAGQQPAKFDLVVNLKNGQGARPHGAAVDLARADEVIE